MEIRELADKVFNGQKELIRSKLPFAEVQHMGSTAVPSSLTKDDLDVNVRISKEKFIEAVEILKGMYEINQLTN